MNFRLKNFPPSFAFPEYHELSLVSREKCQRARGDGRRESSAKKFFRAGINGSRERCWRFCCHWNVQERPEDRNSTSNARRCAALHGVAWRAR